MMNLTPPLPPVTLTDDAMKLAASLLQIASDPSAVKTRLDELRPRRRGDANRDPRLEVQRSKRLLQYA
jgi:hypothetical protein